MKIYIPEFKKLSMIKLFISFITVPCVLVFITIWTMNRESRLHKVTHEVFLDLEIDGKPEGRVVLGLFGEAAPLTVRNFYTLATTGIRGKKYENTHFHRAIRKFMIQGGDVVNGDGTGHISLYGDTFPDETFEISHNSAGFVSMANSGKDTNGCQFFITTIEAKWLDGKHVSFGKVVKGQGIIHKIEYLETDWRDRPLKEVKIAASGSLPVKSPYMLSNDPYDMRDWLKTISFPLLVSFTIVSIFNYFIKNIDKCLDASEELLEKKERALKNSPKDQDHEESTTSEERLDKTERVVEGKKARKRIPADEK